MSIAEETTSVQLGRALHARAMLFSEAVAERLGLNPTDLKCLNLALSEDPVTPGRLAELSGLTTGAITGVLDRLERAGIARREVDPSDRRRVIVRLLPGRRAEIAAIYRPFDDAIAEVLAAYTVGERGAIDQFLAQAQRIFEQETHRLRVVAHGGGLEGDLFSAPLGRARRGTLVFESGAPRLAFQAAPLPGAIARAVAEVKPSRLRIGGHAPDDLLCQARFDGPVPDIDAKNGTLWIGYRHRGFDWRERTAQLALNPTIPWFIEVKGGLSELTADLADLKVAGFQVKAGANELRLSLPLPVGTVPVELKGVVGTLDVLRPEGAAVRLSIKGAVARLRMDDQWNGPGGPNTEIQSADFPQAADRYVVDLKGGASQVTVRIASRGR
jgi:DNA-binding MarR family transcriptional regulator